MYPKIEEFKKNNKCNSSEELFGLNPTYPYTCPDFDSLTANIRDINSMASLNRYDDEDDAEFLLDKLKDIEWASRSLDDDAENLRTAIIIVRDWGQSWKEFAKELIEKNDIDLSDYF